VIGSALDWLSRVGSWALLAAASAPTATAGPETAAIAAELARGRGDLTLEGSPAPYFAELRLVRVEMLTLDGSYGGIITDLHETQGAGTLVVRVGTPEVGSGGVLGSNQEVTTTFPLAPDPAVTRKRVWLAMDAAFRGAAANYSAKQAVLARLAGEPPPPDQAPGPGPVVHLPWGDGLDAPAPRLEVDREALRGLAARLSARFEAHPAVDNGDVVILALRSHLLTVTTEESVLGEIRDRAVLAVVADTQAADGMQLDHAAALHLDHLPTADELEARGIAMVDQVLGELEALAKAPMLDEDYDGPLLFSPVAAAQLLATTVAVHASGDPAPVSDYGRVTELEPHWHAGLGRGVLPSWIDLVDDPLRAGFGHYSVDDEGMPAQRLVLVDDGVLSDLFMTRTPNARVRASNGHARMAPGLGRGPAMSNLELRSRRRGLDGAALERELLARAREDGYDFAYVVESFRDGNLLGPVERESAIQYGGGRKVSLPIPGRLIRIGADGSRTLVRGALFSPVSMRVLRRIRAVGRASQAVPLRIQPGLTGGFGAEVGIDALLTQTVDVQVDTPALLVDGFELLVERGEHERLPTLVHPLRRPGAPERAAP
jgi:hypothetical protein